MRVRVGQALVPMGMGMALARHDRFGMGVAMVLVVLVLVRVLVRLVGMHVRVALGEMQPHAPGHENRSYGEVPGQGFFEEKQTERGAGKWRG
jgi:Na+-transporting methylmalonyl-CoA/oxaloacetate decarboxylase gamma subunit